MKVLRLDTELNRRVTWAKHNFRFTIPCHEIANVQNSKVSWTFSMKGSDTAILILGCLPFVCCFSGVLETHLFNKLSTRCTVHFDWLKVWKANAPVLPKTYSLAD